MSAATQIYLRCWDFRTKTPPLHLYFCRVVSTPHISTIKRALKIGLVKTQTPEAIVRQMLRSASLATCMELMLRFVSTMFRFVDMNHSPSVQVS